MSPTIPDHIIPILNNLSECVHRSGGSLFLVGGCVRDAALRKPLHDLDLEVFGLSLHEVQSVLAECNLPHSWVGRSFGVFKLHPFPIDLGLPRRERRTGLKHKDFSVDIDPTMSVAEAAARRDFTINAMYYNLRDDCLVDPLNGNSHLEAGILCPVGPRFLEDSLRVLRGMQLAARFNLTADPSFLHFAAKMDPLHLSKERIFGEWEKWALQGERPSAGLNILLETGWLQYFPELAALVDCPQDAEHHPEGSVWNHTLAAVDQFAKAKTGERTEDLIIALAVLTHDFGKPLTTETIEGRIHSHGHESAGLVPAESFLERIGFPLRWREDVLRLVKNHMRPGQLFFQNSSDRAVRRLAVEAQRIDRLLRVVEADSGARPPLPNMGAEIRAWMEERTNRMNIQSQKPKPILLGRHLIDLGIPTGPEMGKHLAEAYDAQIEGTFDSLSTALDWARRKWSSK